MSEGQTVYLESNEEVAQRLNITPAGLRRLADIYGEVYEPLQRDSHYNNRRMQTLEAVERLERARELVQVGGARSALLMLQGGIETPVETLAITSKEVSKDPLLLAILEHMQGLEARIEQMQRQLELAELLKHQAEHLQDTPLIPVACDLQRRLSAPLSGLEGYRDASAAMSAHVAFRRATASPVPILDG